MLYSTHMVEALLLLGGNEGDPLALFSEAEALIASRIGKIQSRSRDHWTEPWGFEHDSQFLNRALLITTHLEPLETMEQCLGIEKQLGRVREPGAPPGPRPIDIDILLIEDRVIERSGLQVPHPRMHLREFALSPAVDIAPLWTHPVIGRTLLSILNNLSHSGRDASMK